MSNNKRKTKASDTEHESFATSKQISVAGKTDEECGGCPPPKQRCPPQAKKIPPGMVIPFSEIISSIGGPLSIDQIEIGKVTIQKLDLNNFNGVFNYEKCTAINVILNIEHELKIDFNFSVKMEALGEDDLAPDLHFNDLGIGYTWKDTYGPIPEIRFNRGHFSMQSETVSIGPFSMTPEPIRQTKADEVATEDVKMKCTSIPLESPLCMDIGICLPVQNPMCPNDVIIEETNIKRMDSKRISSQPVIMNDISVNDINIQTITTGHFKARSTSEIDITKPIPPGDKITYRKGYAGAAYDIAGQFTLKITSIEMSVDNLKFENVKGWVTTASAKSGQLDNINLLLKGIKIKGLNLCGMKIPEIEMKF